MIYENREIGLIDTKNLEILLQNGWRHFGTHFYRYSLNVHEGEVCEVWPLRIRLSEFTFRKSQRKILSKARKAFDSKIQPAQIDKERNRLFEIHKQRFKENIPNHLTDFISPLPFLFPTQAKEVAIFKNGKLVACSYFDVSDRSTSSIYAMFDPKYKNYSLGTYTLLVEIDFALREQMDFVYLGYGYNLPSFYDYKKGFNALERFNWKGKWEALQPHQLL